MMKWNVCIALGLMLSFAPISAAQQQPTKRLMIVSIDGLRPDLLLRADAPKLRSLLPQATFTFWATTVPHAITIPSHVSMLTGVVPRRHEIEWNKDLLLSEPVYPKVPTLFEIAHKSGYTTAMLAGKSKFSVLAKPGTLDWIWLPDTEKGEDADVAVHTIELIQKYKPQLLFVHLPTIDTVGHKSGWSSPAQLKAIAEADTIVGRLLDALDDAKVRDSTVVIITADHGGAGLTHLAGDPRSLYIPWIVIGPGIRKNVDLTMYEGTSVNTMDTFATACHLLDLPRPAPLDGKPILEVLEDPGELLQPQLGSQQHAGKLPATAPVIP
jgi:predicted AlkP superfamily pyrophosphatase or phosphodiesterase